MNIATAIVVIGFFTTFLGAGLCNNKVFFSGVSVVVIGLFIAMFSSIASM